MFAHDASRSVGRSCSLVVDDHHRSNSTIRLSSSLRQSSSLDPPGNPSQFEYYTPSRVSGTGHQSLSSPSRCSECPSPPRILFAGGSLRGIGISPQSLPSRVPSVRVDDVSHVSYPKVARVTLSFHCIDFPSLAFLDHLYTDAGLNIAGKRIISQMGAQS